MSEFKGTPGPWVVRKWDGKEWPDRRITVGPESDGIATAVCISPRYGDDGQMEADARLIAAAPELLKALGIIVKLDENKVYMDEPWQEALKLARSAIAKATGEEK